MRKTLLAWICVAAFLETASSGARAQAVSPFIGEVMTFSFGFCPNGWAPLNGALLPISQNTALFALLGTTYGGDGMTTFALPKAPQSTTLTQGAPLIQCIALQGVFPSQN